MTTEETAPLDAMLVIRAQAVAVDGNVVRFSSLMEEDFAIVASAEDASRFVMLQEVDIVAIVSRDEHGAIESGRLESFEVVENGDPAPAWQDWYRKVS